MKLMFTETTIEDRTEIVVFSGNRQIGSLSMEILFDSCSSYEFEDVFTEDEINKIYPLFEIVKMEHVQIDDEYKNLGIGSKLMKRAIKLMRDNGYSQFYLNASPMGSTGLRVNELVEFYRKFGFKPLVNMGHNVLMGVVFQQ